MFSLRDPEGNRSIVRRIASLDKRSGRQWGKMSGPQMLAHCQKPLLVAAGELPLKRGLIGVLFGGLMKRRFVDGPEPFKPDGPTDPRFLVKCPGDFLAERTRLIALVRRFGDEGPQLGKHPFFGPMSPEDWDRLNWKHLDHHLRQFGV